MDEEGFKPPPDFEEDTREPLLDLHFSDSSEFWLIQTPLHRQPELDGQDLYVEIGPNGKLGSFKDSTGKAYDMVISGGQERNEMVFLSSSSEANIVGKISRRVSFVHYPEPEEYEKLIAEKKVPGASISTPMLSNRQRSSQSTWGRPVSTYSSRQKSTLSGVSTPSKHPKGKHMSESTGSMGQSLKGHGSTNISGASENRSVGKSAGSTGQSTVDTGRGSSGTPERKRHHESIGSMDSEHSHKGKSKKKANREE